MNRRLLQFLQAESITQTQLADTLGVARGSVSHILAGRNKPGYDFLESLLLHFPQLNLDWLLTGKGRMYKGEMAPETAAEAGGPSLFPTRVTPEGRQIERILVFFNDNTWQEFHPTE